MLVDKQRTTNRRVRLSPRQRLIWLETQMLLPQPVNIELYYLSVEGPIDVAALREAFRRLCLRHDALRARLSAGRDEDGLPELAFDDEPAASLEHKAIGPGELRTHLGILTRAPFALGEVLVRPALLSEGNALHHVVLAQSHLVTDGRSGALLFSDLEALYQEVRVGAPAPASGNRYYTYLSSLPATPDAAAAEFWRARLGGRPPLVRFYGQAPLPVRGIVARTTRSIEEPVGAGLLERRTGFAPSIVFASVTAATVRRVAGDSLVALGVPVLNRTTDHMLDAGLFMEVVPNRLEVADELSFGDIARALGVEAAAVRPYRSYTVTTVESGHEITLNYYPPALDYFAGFGAHITFTSALQVQDAVTPLFGALDAGHGVMIYVFSTSAGRPCEVAFDFDLGRWADKTLHERFAGHFMAMLHAFVDNPERPVGAVDILTAAERAQTVADANKWQSFPARLPDVVEMLRETAARRPDHTAVVFENRRLSYRQLIARIEAIATGLVRHGITTGSLVAIRMGRSEDVVIAMLAVLHAGGTYIPLDPVHPEYRLRAIIDDAAPALLVTDGSTAIIDPARAVAFDDLAAEPLRPTVMPPPGEIAYIIFTSGSTGQPKGVRVRRHSLSALLLAMRERPGLVPSDRLLSVTTVAFDIAALELFLPLIAGATVHIAPYAAGLDGAELARRMEDAQITVLQGTPATFRVLLGAGWRGRGIKVLCGGESMPDDLARRLIESCGEVWNMYGPTETTIWSSVERIDHPHLPVTIGRPIRGTRFSVRTTLGALTPLGTLGELNISGHGVADGYHDRPELTAQKFVADATGETRYRTGDTVRQLPDGRFAYIGRTDFQVKVRGFRIELGEIEACIGQVSGVEKAAVITFTDASRETALAAYYVGDPRAETQRAIETHIARHLPAYMRPSLLIHLEAMPLTSNGKTDRKALPAPDVAAALSTADETFENDLQIAVAAIWKRLLGARRIGPDTSFFEAGGHSLLALNLVCEVERVTGTKLDLGIVFAAPTLREMTERIRVGFEVSSGTTMVPLQNKGDGAPLFCICGIETYRPFARALGEECPVYAIYVEDEKIFLEQAAAGLTNDISIAKLAQSYAKAILRAQSEGPYQLAGVSLGGLLALEIARILEASGHEVAIVVMFDTVRRDGRRIAWPAFAADKARELLTVGPGKILPNLMRRLRVLTLRTRLRRVSTESELIALREIAFIKAMEAYHGVCDVLCPVLLIKAADHDATWGGGYLFADDYGWGAALGKPVRVIEIPGDHLGILKPPCVEELARHVRAELRAKRIARHDDSIIADTDVVSNSGQHGRRGSSPIPRPLY
jgi:amino acid adenylation domain-containing protein